MQLVLQPPQQAPLWQQYCSTSEFILTYNARHMYAIRGCDICEQCAVQTLLLSLVSHTVARLLCWSISQVRLYIPRGMDDWQPQVRTPLSTPSVNQTWLCSLTSKLQDHTGEC